VYQRRRDWPVRPTKELESVVDSATLVVKSLKRRRCRGMTARDPITCLSTEAHDNIGKMMCTATSIQGNSNALCQLWLKRRGGDKALSCSPVPLSPYRTSTFWMGWDGISSDVRLVRGSKTRAIFHTLKPGVEHINCSPI
jgi:hypothetical protein